jgi:hypothetical protein
MPPLFISPLAKIAVAALGTAAVVCWAVLETLRLKKDARVTRATDAEAASRQAFPTLRRDPRSGDWHLQRTESR